MPEIEVNDAVLERLKVAGSEARSIARNYVGSDDQVNELMAWASQNLTPAEAASLNESFGDPSRVESAVAGLVNRRAGASKAAHRSAVKQAGGAVTLREFEDLRRRAAEGDPDAIRGVAATDVESLQ